MTAALIREMAYRGIRLSRNGDRLHWEAPKRAMTPDVQRQLLAHKLELLAALAGTEAKLDHLNGKTQRHIFEYTLKGRPDAWLVMIGADGESYQQGIEGLRHQYGDELLDARPYRYSEGTP